MLDHHVFSRMPSAVGPLANPAENSVSGETPLVQLEGSIYAKLEYYRPTGSYKDRMAAYCLNTARKEGRLHAGRSHFNTLPAVVACVIWRSHAGAAVLSLELHRPSVLDPHRGCCATTDIHTVVAPSSGNTSSAVACYCRDNGYRCIVVVPKKCSIEKRENARRYARHCMQSGLRRTG
jgi:threonine synthase